VAFDITITFNKQTACLRVALTGEDYSDKPLKALLAQINVHAANEVSGAYTIVGLSQGGARLDSGKALRTQGVPPGGALTAIVQVLNAVFARAAGKANAAPPKPAQPPEPAPPLEPPLPAPPQQGSAATHTGQKRGPKAGAPKVDKKTKPPLWTVGGALALDGSDAGARMDTMAGKVEKAGGVPVAGDGAGRGIWCVSCGKLQPHAGKGVRPVPVEHACAHQQAQGRRCTARRAPVGASSGAGDWQRALAGGAHGAVARDARGPRRAQPRRVNMHIGCSPDCKRCDVMILAESEWAIDNSMVVSHFLNLRSASRD
jgi:hypothetical protein